ncbi:hypothetical protein ABPG72_011778 [Tetrahymena utriculariae]
MNKSNQIQILKESQYQIVKNNFEAIMLSFNRVLYLLGYHDFLKKNLLLIVGQNFRNQPTDINVEFQILLFQMLNLKQINGLSECESIKQFEDTLYSFYKSLNQKFVEDIFILSKLSIQGKNDDAKNYFVELKKKYPDSFVPHTINLPNKRSDKIQIPKSDLKEFELSIPQNQILESTQFIAYIKQQSSNLIQDQLSGKIKDEDYNKNIYITGLIKKFDQNQNKKA